MLSVYDDGQKYPVSNATEFYITHVDGGEDTLDFTVLTDDPIYAHLAEENRVEYGDNGYNIKSIDAPGSSANIHCEIDIDFLKANFHKAYDSGSVTLPVLLGSTTAGSPTFSSGPSGTYYRVGKLVIINLSFQLSGKGGMAGTVYVGGLPFAAARHGSLCISSAYGLSLTVDNCTILANGDISLGPDAANVDDAAAIWAATGFYVCA